MRREFEMTPEQRETLLKAMQPVPVMFLSGGQPMFRSVQENANDAWEKLGREMGFKHMTVRPVPGKPDTFFTAEETQRQAAGGGDE